MIFALAIAPGSAIAVYVYFRDRYEKEPLSMLMKTFVAGFFAVTPAALIETMLIGMLPEGSTQIRHVALNNVIFVGLTEELIKFFCVYWIVYHTPDFNEPFDGIVYSAMAAMGFATAENLLYVIDGGVQVALMRMFTAVPAHATFGIMMGYFVGLSKFRNHHVPFLILGIAVATVFHGLYDLCLSINDIELIALGALVSLALGIRFSFKAMRILSENSPFRYSTIFQRK